MSLDVHVRFSAGLSHRPWTVTGLALKEPSTRHARQPHEGWSWSCRWDGARPSTCHQSAGLERATSWHAQSPQPPTAALLIQAHPDQCWSLSEVATTVHLSPSQLGRTFREKYGCTHLRYLREIRFTKMKFLLRAINYSVIEIASMAGCLGRRYATRQFKKVVGDCPTKFRVQAMRSQIYSPDPFE